MRKNNQTRRILPMCGADKKVNNFLWRTVQMCRYFLTTCTNKLHEDKNIKQMSCYTQEIGRSMVEMLGVLAIIGVLSVGAIAGYSKAMDKYKLNKHAQSFNLFLNNAIQYSGKLHSSTNKADINNAEYLAEMFLKLNLIPDDFIYLTHTYIADNFGNYMWPYTSSDNITSIGIELSSSNYNRKVCYNLVITAKENKENIRSISISELNDNVTHSYGHLYGDNFCKPSVKCLTNLKITDIDILCNTCTGQRCRLYISLK